MILHRPDVLVLGAGLAGLACARDLAGAGHAVTVLERREGAGLEASSAGAGMLSPLLETREDGANAPLFEACREARDLWPRWAAELREETGLPLDHDTSGAIVVSLDSESEIEWATIRSRARLRGEPCEEISIEEARKLVPDLTKQARRALLLAGEHRVDNVQAVAALTRSCVLRGVGLRFGVEVARVEVEKDRVGVVTRGELFEASAAIVAMGAWSGGISGLPPLPVRPVRGQMMRIARVEWPFAGTVRLAGCGYAVRRGNGLLVGATAEEVGFENEVTARGRAWLRSLRERLFPSLADSPIEAIWSGLRPGSEDGLPILGRIEENVFVATGLSRHGILLAPWIGREVSRMVRGEEGSEFQAPFSPQRFALADLRE